MYLPKHFEQPDRGALIALMRERPLATLIVGTPDGPTADLIPLEYLPNVGEHGLLRGHVARANPLWRHAGAPALAVFTGPEAYISPGWYATKREHGKVVPTWNYTMVQASGVLQVVDEAPWLRALVGRLTDHHEAALQETQGRPKFPGSLSGGRTPQGGGLGGVQQQPWSVSDAPDDYVQQMLRAIVGFEIPLTSLLGKWKVSQNRGLPDREGVAQGLAATQPAMAALVRPAD